MTCRSCHRHRRHCRPRPPPIRRPNAAKCPGCRPARPNCVCFTRNTCRPSGTASRPGWPNAGRSFCTAGGTVPWPLRTSAPRSSDPICKQVRRYLCNKFGRIWGVGFFVVPNNNNIPTLVPCEIDLENARGWDGKNCVNGDPSGW